MKKYQIHELKLPKKTTISNKNVSELISGLYPIFVIKEYDIDASTGKYNGFFRNKDFGSMILYNPNTNKYSDVHTSRELTKEEMHKHIIDYHHNITNKPNPFKYKGGKRKRSNKRKSKKRRKRSN